MGEGRASQALPLRLPVTLTLPLRPVQVSDGLRGEATVSWYGEAVGVQGESKRQLDAAVLDLWLLATASSEVLVSRGSTYSYVAHGLGNRPATIYGASHNSAAAHGSSACDCKMTHHLASLSLFLGQCRKTRHFAGSEIVAPSC